MAPNPALDDFLAPSYVGVMLTRLRISLTFALAALLFVVASPLAHANAWYTYYNDYFYTQSNCEARGWVMVNLDPPLGVPGIVAYRCWRRSGQIKWNMDVYDTYARAITSSDSP